MPLPKRHTAVFVCLGLVGLSGGEESAFAQEFVPEIATGAIDDLNHVPDVRSRIEDEFQPIGIRSGSFFIYPEVGAEIGATSNVLASPTNEEEDAFVRSFASFRVVRPDPGSRLQIGGEAEYTGYASDGDENTLDGMLNASYRGGSTMDSHLLTSLLAARRHVDRRSINDIAAGESPVAFDIFQASASYVWRGGEWTFTPLIELSRFDFHSVDARGGGTIGQEHRDYNRYAGGLEVRRELSGTIAVIGRGELAQLDYDLEFGDSAFDPLSDLDRDSMTYEVEGGVGVSLSDRLNGSVTVGYSGREFDGTTGGPLDSGGFSFGGDLVWMPSVATAVHLEAERGFAESASPVVAGYTTTRLAARIDQSVGFGLILGGFGRALHLVPNGLGSNSTEYGLGSDLTWYLSRQARFVAGASYSARNSNNPIDEFDEFRCWISAIASF